MRASEFITDSIKLRAAAPEVTAWIEKVYAKYPYTMQNNHVMVWGSGEEQQFAMFELVPSMSKRGAVEVKWFQAYPLRAGVGSRAMKELQTMAQQDGIVLTLFPWDKGQISQSKLTKFYKGHGFKPTTTGSKNMAWSPTKMSENINSAIMHRGWQTQAHRDGLDLQAKANEQGLSIHAYDAGGREIGFVHFEIIDDNLESFDTWVDSRMRRQGIATVMYNYAKELGNDIAPSTAQTPDGKKFWKSIKKQQTTEGREEFNQDIMQPGFEFEQEMSGITYKVTNDSGMVRVTAWDPEGNSIGHAVFWKHQTRSGLESLSTEVNTKWHGKGIATNMYAIVRMLGANINPSLFQSKQGKDMWKKWQQQGDVAQLKNMNAKLKSK